MYKIGDKVKIKTRIFSEYDYPCCFIDDMLPFCGKIATINEISPIEMSNDNKQCSLFNGDENIYHIDLDDHEFLWSSSMFDHIILDTNFVNLNYFL